MRTRRSLCILLTLSIIVTLCLSACDGDDDDDDLDDDDDDTLGMEAGYFEIEPIHFTLRNDQTETDFTSAATRIWYEFQPAEESPQTKPLVLLFNGGPGCATHFLFGFGTATWVVAPDTPALFLNPYTWRQFANLLYIDARGTGLSYGMMDNPEDQDARIAEFDTPNYNAYLDAGDYIRLLLRFLSIHPSIQANPVVIAGESYGGTRSTAILNILLRYAEYGGQNEVYQDAALADEIQIHLDAVFPDRAGTVHSPESIASQFGRQLLIEPLITGNNQFELSGAIFEKPGSIIYQIADETQTTYTPCDPQDDECDPFDNALDFLTSTAQRDFYVYPKPANWSFEQGLLAVAQMTTVDGLMRMTQTDVTDIAYLYSDQRDRAYRVGEIDTGDSKGRVFSSPGWKRLPAFARYSLLACLEQNRNDDKTSTNGELPDTFGELNPWDTYHIDCSMEIEDAFYSETATEFGVDPVSEKFGAMFLYNLLYVDTFITHAAYDLIIYAPVIPDSLALYNRYVEQVRHIETPQDGEERPGWIEVTYKEGAFGEAQAGEKRMIRFPIYAESGHAVELSQPGELFEDMRNWLADSQD